MSERELIAWASNVDELDGTYEDPWGDEEVLSVRLRTRRSIRTENRR